MKYLKIFGIACCCTFLVFACKKPDEYPLVPVIEFKNIYTVKDNQGYDKYVYVVISFTDGDGDIGYHSPESGLNEAEFDDPSSPYFNNYIVKTFIMQSNAWVTIDTPISSRIPYLTPESANKALKGEILREFTVPVPLVDDTIRYEIFIYDRARQKSNTITTPSILLNTR